MPPVAAARKTQPNEQTPRDAYMRPLQTCRKRRTITGLRGNKNIPTVGAGHCPARDPTIIAIFRANRTAGWGHPALRGNGDLYANIAGWFVGAAYMPPVAAIPITQLNG